MARMFRLTQLTLFILAMSLSAFALGAATDWRDLESRVQYAWYTEDARDLAAVATRVTDLPATEALRSYYLTLIQLREAQVLKDASAEGRAAGGCISSAEEVLAARPTDAEALALQAFCMDLRSRISAVGVPFAGARSRAQMQRAAQLAPQDPRVRLLAAQLAYVSARSTQERTVLLAPFQSAVDGFEQERQGVERVPSWGAPEAWQGLAQVYLDRGDAIAAPRSAGARSAADAGLQVRASPA